VCEEVNGANSIKLATWKAVTDEYTNSNTNYYYYYYYYYYLQLSCHSVVVVLTLVTNKNIFT